jgi:hypothetical protein
LRARCRARSSGTTPASAAAASSGSGGFDRAGVPSAARAPARRSAQLGATNTSDAPRAGAAPRAAGQSSTTPSPSEGVVGTRARPGVIAVSALGTSRWVSMSRVSTGPDGGEQTGPQPRGLQKPGGGVAPERAARVERRTTRHRESDPWLAAPGQLITRSGPAGSPAPDQGGLAPHPCGSTRDSTKQPAGSPGKRGYDVVTTADRCRSHLRRLAGQSLRRVSTGDRERRWRCHVYYQRVVRPRSRNRDGAVAGRWHVRADARAGNHWCVGSRAPVCPIPVAPERRAQLGPGQPHQQIVRVAVTSKTGPSRMVATATGLAAVYPHCESTGRGTRKRTGSARTAPDSLSRESGMVRQPGQRIDSLSVVARAFTTAASSPARSAGSICESPAITAVTSAPSAGAGVPGHRYAPTPQFSGCRITSPAPLAAACPSLGPVPAGIVDQHVIDVTGYGTNGARYLATSLLEPRQRCAGLRTSAHPA